MGKFSPKNPIHCSVCKKVFIPSNPRNHLCSDECRHMWDLMHGRNRSYKNGVYVKHGYNQSGKNNNNWKGGTKYRHLVKIEKCELCDSTNNLVVHHIDHNRSNNCRDNLMVLCKRCHQEHHCVRDNKGRYACH